jgi:phytoene dehydrogenase-like protein
MSAATTFDVIIIGAGANGLVAAHLLALSGRKVLVLEQQAEETASRDIGWIPPRVIADLDLMRHGLVVDEADPWAALALDGGGRLELSPNLTRSAEAIGKLSVKDALRWPEFCARMHKVASVLGELYRQPAPDVETTDPGELLRLGLIALKVKGLGRQGMIDLMRLLPMSVADLLNEWFESDALKAVLGIAGVMHLRQGPRSGGTAFNFLHHHVGSAPGVFRPPSSNLGAVLAGLPGIEVRRGARVSRIRVAKGRVSGVVLANGNEFAASRVLSGADPRSTLLGLLEPGWLDPGFVRAVGSIKCRGVAAQVNLTLKGDAPFRTLAIAPSLTYLERAYDDVKYGRASANPWLEARSLGGRVEVHVQYVPHTVSDGSVLGDQVVRMMDERVPGFAGSITNRMVLTPADLAAQGLTEGQRYHGELTLDQILFMRPVAGWTRYRTPIPGLYLCGAGTHPGGAIAGGSGWLAARQVLDDTRL